MCADCRSWRFLIGVIFFALSGVKPDGTMYSYNNSIIQPQKHVEPGGRRIKARLAPGGSLG